MKILLDTNILLDIFLQRDGFYEFSKAAIKKAIINCDRIYLSSTSIVDTYYFLKKAIGKEKAFNKIRKISELMYFAEVNQDIIFNAMNSKMGDFEDAIIDSVASSIKADFILTRNNKDFKNALTPNISPIDFLKKKFN